jgi:hypothetical protein
LSEHAEEHVESTNGAHRTGFGSPGGADPAEAGRRSGAVRRGEVPRDPHALAKALIRSGAKQGAWGDVRQLERQRGEKQATVEELERRHEELTAEVGELEATIASSRRSRSASRP